MSLKERQRRQCPHCKGKKGYRETTTLTGNSTEDKTFSGRIIDAQRHEFGTTDDYVNCLNCNKSFRLIIDPLYDEYGKRKKSKHG